MKLQGVDKIGIVRTEFAMNYLGVNLEIFCKHILFIIQYSGLPQLYLRYGWSVTDIVIKIYRHGCLMFSGPWNNFDFTRLTLREAILKVSYDDFELKLTGLDDAICLLLDQLESLVERFFVHLSIRDGVQK